MKLATLCYIERDNRILMLHRNKKPNDMHQGFWVGLGGKFEAGESPEDCVIREVQEECGLTLTNPHLRGIITFPNDHGEDWYVFLFTANEFTGTFHACDEGELAWIEKEKLFSLPMHEGDKHFLRCLEHYTGVFTAKLIYDGETLESYQVIPY